MVTPSNGWLEILVTMPFVWPIAENDIRVAARINNTSFMPQTYS